MTELKGKDESYFDVSKYAQINQVALSRNMMRYGHMDEWGVGTDCKDMKRQTKHIHQVFNSFWDKWGSAD